MKSRRNLSRFTYETTAFQGWRLCIARCGTTFTKYFSDKKYGSPTKALRAAEKALKDVKVILTAPKRSGKLTKKTEALVKKRLNQSPSAKKSAASQRTTSA